ncbi:MAG: cardiolipin synthase [Elusimicrobiota bacterium]
MNSGLIAATILETIRQFQPHIAGALTLAITVAASVHVLVNKRDSRAATGWIGLIWLAPVIGAGVYMLLGINRIRRKAVRLRKGASKLRFARRREAAGTEALRAVLGPDRRHLLPLARVMDNVTRRPLLAGNRILPLQDGSQAYPAMLRAVDEAERSVSLASYIFSNDAVGATFREALGRAVRRGVQVRVLIDDVGARYSVPPITSSLRRAGVRVAHFMPTMIPWGMPYVNLRSHRKILVADGRTGFTGGLNIGQSYQGRDAEPPRIRDLHFRVEGPVVADLQEVFAEDWFFCTGERLSEEAWFPPLAEAGGVLARGIADGPDEDFDKLRWTLLGAIECAGRSVIVVTPYFLPDEALVTALCVAAMAGVRVDILLPERSNLRLVQWASYPLLPELLARGCRIWLSPPPFDHSKLMLVDSSWALLGSGNWDPRSLALNFEFNLECYSPGLAAALERIAARKRRSARELKLADLMLRNRAARLRDAAVRLLSPYL